MKRKHILWIVVTISLAFLGYQRVRYLRDKAKQEAKREARRGTGNSFLHSRHQMRDAEQTAKAFSDFADGREIRIVWVEDTAGEDNADVFSHSSKLRLMGISSLSPVPRAIAPQLGNYSRPLLAPDGASVFYTDKGRKDDGQGTTFEPKIRMISWDGTGDRELAPGAAVCVRKDTATGTVWVYALERIISGGSPSCNGESLIRFPLANPAMREKVWNKKPMAWDNIQFSRDGAFFTAILTNRSGVIADTKTGSSHRLSQGCWPSLSPDNSRLAWVFHGSHRKVRMFDTQRSKNWTVDLYDAPGIKGHECYHPRWSNDPNFLVMTGPYFSKAKKAHGSTGLAAHGATAEIYLGKFAANQESVADWLQLTRNSSGDFYPDAWIAGGDDVMLAGYEQSVQPVEAPQSTASEGLTFIWNDLETDNQLMGRDSHCSVTPRGIGRFSRRLAMILDGGFFEADPDSASRITDRLMQSQECSLSFRLLESGVLTDSESVRLITLGGQEKLELAISRSPQELVIQFGDQSARAPLPAKAEPQTVHIHLKWAAGTLAWKLNGQAAPVLKLSEPALTFPNPAELQFGDGSFTPVAWSAELDRVVWFDGTHAPEEMQANLPEPRPEPPPTDRLIVDAVLVEATTPDVKQLDTYDGMLVDHTYEVKNIVSGKYEGQRILVLHWGILDKRLIPHMPRIPGQEYQLVLEPHEDHPQLDSELTEILSEEIELPLFIDVGTPHRH